MNEATQDNTTSATEAEPQGDGAVVAGVRRLIAARMNDPRFSLDEAARSLKMSRRAVQKQLQTAHASFSAMLLEARLDLARTMLLQSDGRVCIEEICYRCGFGELSTFYRAFKSRFGVPPATYRNQLLERP